MQKDLKIGLILGLMIISAVGLWLATRPSLTPQARLRGEDVPALRPPGDPAAALGTDLPTAENKGRMPSPRGMRDEKVRRPSPEARAPVRRAVVENAVESNRLAAPAVDVQPETIKPLRFHIVREGETLSEISYDYYGSASKWRKIFEANRNTIKNENFVRAGTKLIIPD